MKSLVRVEFVEFYTGDGPSFHSSGLHETVLNNCKRERIDIDTYLVDRITLYEDILLPELSLLATWIYQNKVLSPTGCSTHHSQIKLFPLCDILVNIICIYKKKR